MAEVHSVRATLIGTVCMGDASSTSCPPSSPIFSGPTGSNLTVSVNIQESEAFKGFDISLKTDPLVLKPVSIDLSASLIQGPDLVLRDTFCSDCGSAEVAVLISVAEFQIPAPATGNLFRVTYRIVGPSVGNTIRYDGLPIVTGCSTLTECVVLPENTQAALFAFPVYLAVDPLSLSLQQGSKGTMALTLASMNGFAGTVAISAITVEIKHSPKFFLSDASLALAPGSQATTLLKVSINPNTPITVYPAFYAIVVTVTISDGSPAGSTFFPLVVTGR